MIIHECYMKYDLTYKLSVVCDPVPVCKKLDVALSRTYTHVYRYPGIHQLNEI